MGRVYTHHKRTVKANDIISSSRYDDSNKDEFWIGYKLKRKPFLKSYKEDNRNTINTRVLIEHLVEDLIINQQPIIITQFITNINTFRIILNRVLTQPKYLKTKVSLRKLNNEIIITLADQDKQRALDITLDYYYINNLTITASNLTQPNLLSHLLHLILCVPARISYSGNRKDLEGKLNELLTFPIVSETIRIISQPDNQSHDLRIYDSLKLKEYMQDNSI